MDVMTTLELPYPPSINHYFSIYQGRPMLSKEAKAYRQVVRQRLQSAGIKPRFGPLAVRIDIRPPDHRTRDCDNVQKTILDALHRGGAMIDDSQIVWLLTVKLSPVAGGRATVTIQGLDEGPLPSAFEPEEVHRD
jgi:crossover junction endodeoxyribonuclease RusA